MHLEALLGAKQSKSALVLKRKGGLYVGLTSHCMKTFFRCQEKAWASVSLRNLCVCGVGDGVCVCARALAPGGGGVLVYIRKHNCCNVGSSDKTYI